MIDDDDDDDDDHNNNDDDDDDKDWFFFHHSLENNTHFSVFFSTTGDSRCHHEWRSYLRGSRELGGLGGG